MGTTTLERVSGEGAGGTGGPSGSNSGSFYGEPAPAVFARPFLGWLALADAVADTAPDTAELMTAAAYLAQSALEERLPDLIGPLSDVLANSGFSSGAVEGVRSALLANRLAFTPQAVTDELVSLYADLGEEHQLRSGDGPLQLVEAAIEGFLDSDLAGPNARTVYDNMADRAAQYRHPHWWASCSLDLPSVLGTAKPPIYCARPGWHRRLDRLAALEWTYRGTVSTGFNGELAGRGPVGVVTAGGGYRDSIDDLKLNRYWDTLSVPSTGLAFGLSLSEGLALRWASKVAKALEGRRADIEGIIGKQVGGARARIDTLLAAAKIGTFFIHPVVGLMVTAAHAVVEAIFDCLVKTLSVKNLTTWGIWHTAVMGQRHVPISVFTLSSPGAGTPGLQYLRAGKDPAELIASDDYGADPGYLSQARFMIGASELPHGQFNDAFFDLTDRSRQPLVWREPMTTNGGFRILVPHRASGTKASYVSALRVDVQLEERPEQFHP